MSDKAKRIAAAILTALLAAAGALVGLDGIPARLHQLCAVLLAVGGAIGTALLPGVALPRAAPAAPPASPTPEGHAE